MLSNVQKENNELKLKIDNLQALKESDSREISRQQTKIRELTDKNAKFMNNNNRLQEEITVLNDNYTQKIRQLRESENVKTSLNLQIK